MMMADIYKREAIFPTNTQIFLGWTNCGSSFIPPGGPLQSLTSFKGKVICLYLAQQCSRRDPNLGRVCPASVDSASLSQKCNLYFLFMYKTSWVLHGGNCFSTSAVALSALLAAGLIRDCTCSGAAPVAGGAAGCAGRGEQTEPSILVTPDGHQHLPPAWGAHSRWWNNQHLTLRNIHPPAAPQNCRGACSTLRERGFICASSVWVGAFQAFLLFVSITASS